MSENTAKWFMSCRSNNIADKTDSEIIIQTQRTPSVNEAIYPTLYAEINIFINAT